MWATAYLTGITIFGVLTLLLSLLDRFQAIEWRAFRATAFACLGLFGVVPYVHALATHSHVSSIWLVASIDAIMAVAYLGGAAIYAARIPERYYPGRFDLLLHSHQIFHLCVLAGAYAHYLAVIELLRWRDASGGCAMEVANGEVQLSAMHLDSPDGQHLDPASMLAYLQQRLYAFLHEHGSAAAGAVCPALQTSPLDACIDPGYPMTPWLGAR
jgi:lysylphosphatidylglycerol synthetase-like protein (DUF2156 family)